MSIFGWSYPPGCNSVPGDDPVPPCQVCGKTVDLEPEKGGCDCKECPTCGQLGCLEHIPDRDLISGIELMEYMLDARNKEMERREKSRVFKCEKCDTEVVPHLRNEWYETCPKCKALLGANGKIVEDL